MTSVTVTSPFSITPSSASLFGIGTRQFTASAAVTWSASCGTINSATGFYTAPAAAATCKITATAASGIAYTGIATANASIINYTTFMGNNARTGAQTRERVLTPANVNSTHFGLAWSMALDGGIWTQPLYMNALTINGAPHNVVFETTSQDSVYAIDADTGTQLWKRSFLSAGVTAVVGSSINSSMNPVGIVGTPAIDPASRRMYFVAMTAENNNTVFIHRLHAIDVRTGLEAPNSPVTFSAPGFADYKQMQRASLLLANGRVYVAFGGIRDSPPYQGFVFSFDAATLALMGVFTDDPSAANGGGIWMSGTGPSADQSGNIYVTSGNGDTDGFRNFGQSAIKLSPDLSVLDYFTPFDHVTQSAVDRDLGGGGVLIVPDQTSGPYLHELIVCGKPTPIYVLNRDQMGHIGAISDNIIQRLDGVIGQTGNFRDSGMPCFSTPAFWQQNVYIVANHDVMKRFTLNSSTGLLSSTPVSQGTFNYAWPGAYASVSSNGASNGIVWTYEYTTGTLRATDALNVSKELFVGSVYTSTKWSTPTVVNGHVYVFAQNRIFAFAPH
jgi:outer membrane protein assembly factor BamB